MNYLQDKKVLLIVTGSIAAYKSAVLTRLLVNNGAEVKIIMTTSAAAFITPLTLSTLSKNEVLLEMMSENQWNSHVDLGIWADVLLVAPATANTIAKMATGIADNLALTSYLSVKCPVVIAPAMDLDMWKHPATRHNTEKLKSYGHHFIDVGKGELASGLVGEGRMAEPENIVAYLNTFFSKKKRDLVGKSVLITAGPSYENIDPVRFIGNYSSGKMGIELAETCFERGADVQLILGPSNEFVSKNIKLYRVVSAKQMAEKTFEFQETADIIILAAAVADYTPIKESATKIKKKEGILNLALKRTTDIALKIGAEKRRDQLLIGFALETDNEIANAKEKLFKKNFDFIVLNSLRDAGSGFKHDTNKISILYKDNKISSFELKTKKEVSNDIVNAISAWKNF